MNFDTGTAPFVRGESIRMREDGFKIKKGDVVKAQQVTYASSIQEWCVEVSVPGWNKPVGYRASRFESVKKRKAPMAVKPFTHLHDLTDLALVKRLRAQARSAHESIQKLEAGAKATKGEKAVATFLFLNLIGFYGEGYSATMIDDAGHVTVRTTNEKAQWTGWYNIFPLLGPDANYKDLMMSPPMVLDAIRASWPKAVVTVGDGIEDKEDDYWVVTIREGGYDKNPLASGSATCTNKTVALMQAYVRMLEDVLSRCIGMIYDARAAMKQPFEGRGPWVRTMNPTRNPWPTGFEPSWFVFNEPKTMKPRQTGKTDELIRDAINRANKRDAEIEVARLLAKKQIDDIFDKLATKYKGSLG